MHSTACGIGATSSSSGNSSANQTATQSQTADGLKMVHNNDDALNKIPLNSASGLDDEEKNAGEFLQDTAAAEEARREKMRANILKWMKKLTIVVICFIGIALITYVIVSLCFSDWPKSTYNTTTTSTTTTTTTTIAPPPTPLPIQLLTTSTVPTAILAAITASTASASSSSPSESSLSPADDSTANAPDSIVSNSTSDSVLLKALGATAISPLVVTTQQPSKAAVKSTTKPPPIMPLEDAMVLNLHDAISVEPAFQSKLGVYKKAAVASDREVCSRIGSHMLVRNGSAVDAAIATMFCNGLLNLHSMGIGGGMLMNVYIAAEKRAYAIDARDVASYAATSNMFDHLPDKNSYGGLVVNVPGEVMGYHQAHERFGKLPWRELLEPSLKLCHDGFVFSEHQFNAVKSQLALLKNSTMLSEMFLDAATGEPLPLGTKLKPPQQLCDSYEMLADNGARDFYNGSLARLILEDLKEIGSTITSYDLETYTADLVSSITMQLGNDTLHAMPPVSSGSVVAHVLSILEGYNFSKADLGDAKSQALTVHRIVEALKFGFAKRAELGDVRFNDVRELVSKLTNPEYGNEMRALINDSGVHEQIDNYGAEFMNAADSGTSHISVLAPNGDAVAATSSVNYYFGAGHMGKRTGIVFNSGIYDFSFPRMTNIFNIPPAASNYVDARKRAMSSMSPMLLTTPEGHIKMVVGAAGGSNIISAVVEVMARVLWFGEDIKQAIDAPRFHHQLIPNVLDHEEGAFSEEVIKLLQAKGHTLKAMPRYASVVIGIVRNETAVYASSDYRKRGSTHGF